MLEVSYNTTIKSGFLVNKKLYKYIGLDLLKLKHILTYISLKWWRLFYLKFEHQMVTYGKKEPILTESNILGLNDFCLKNYPTNHLVITLTRYNIIRKYLIRSFKGKCHLKGKPVRGQRTWSNRKNARNVNLFLRKYINTSKKLKLDNWE